jgi:hypothetical protein
LVTVLCTGHADSDEAEESDLEDVQILVKSHVHIVHVLEPATATSAKTVNSR